MAKSNEQGMQTFDQALYKLYTDGEVTYEAALAHADSPNDLRLMIKLGSGNHDPMEAADSLSIEEDTDEVAGYRR
jgi:twitching motility protein PilU